MRQLKQRALILLVLLMVAGCAAKKPTAANPNPATPFQQVMLWNQGLAEANNGIAKAVIGLTQSQPPLIDPSNAQRILALQFRIAAADKKLTAILEQGPEYTSGHASEVNDFITDISSAATQLTTSGTVGITNPQSQASINGLIVGLSGLAKLIVTGLQAAGVLKAEMKTQPMTPNELLAAGSVIVRMTGWPEIHARNVCYVEGRCLEVSL